MVLTLRYLYKIPSGAIKQVVLKARFLYFIDFEQRAGLNVNIILFRLCHIRSVCSFEHSQFFSINLFAVGKLARRARIRERRLNLTGRNGASRNGGINH